MSMWSLAIAFVCAAAGEAAAERAITVEAIGVPFDRRELIAAIRVRVAADGAPLTIRVVATVTGVRIETPTGTRDVVLGGMHGGDAARLIALAADDLLLDALAMGPAPVVGAAAPTEHARPMFGVLGSVAAWSSAVPGLALALTLPRARWLVDVELGGSQLTDSALRLTAAVIRLDVGRRFGVLDLRAGLTTAPLFVTTGAGDQTVLFGGNVSARVQLPVANALQLVAALGVDGFVTRTEYRVASARIATPRVAPWLTAGVEIGL